MVTPVVKLRLNLVLTILLSLNFVLKLLTLLKKVLVVVLLHSLTTIIISWWNLLLQVKLILLFRCSKSFKISPTLLSTFNSFKMFWKKKSLCPAPRPKSSSLLLAYEAAAWLSLQVSALDCSRLNLCYLIRWDQNQSSGVRWEAVDVKKGQCTSYCPACQTHCEGWRR